MLYEKKKLLIHRSIWLILLILGIFIPVIISNAPKKEVEIIDDNGYINEYYESLDETNCEIEVVFNCYVDSGNIMVAFYDSSGKLLSKESGYFYACDNTVSSTFFIDGKVGSYEILSYDISASGDMPYIVIKLFIYGDITVFAFFIASFLLSYKDYEYNDNNIVVYAGWYHHYIKINGKKIDEHNTLVSSTAIPLSCTLDDGTDMKVIITTSNRISLKINNQIYTKRK
ncbi:MAG: hypothetical protein RR348_03020 [Clostridia bacterium]